MFKLEVQEVALRETKLRARREVEHANMTLCDAESKLFQIYRGDTNVTKLLNM